MKNIKAIIGVVLVVATFVAINIIPEVVGAGATLAALAGFYRVCGLQSGGGKKIYLTEVANVTSMTATNGVYTAITMNGAAKFYVYEFEPDSFEIKEEVSVENNCMKVMHGIEFFMAKMSSTTRTALEEIALASACGLIAVVEDNNGTKWVLGYSENHLKTRPLTLKSGKGTTGKKLTDANGYTITLENENNEMMRTCTATPTT